MLRVSHAPRARRSGARSLPNRAAALGWRRLWLDVLSEHDGNVAAARSAVRHLARRVGRERGRSRAISDAMALAIEACGTERVPGSTLRRMDDYLHARAAGARRVRQLWEKVSARASRRAATVNAERRIVSSRLGDRWSDAKSGSFLRGLLRLAREERAHGKRAAVTTFRAEARRQGYRPGPGDVEAFLDLGRRLLEAGIAENLTEKNAERAGTALLAMVFRERSATLAS